MLPGGLDLAVKKVFGEWAWHDCDSAGLTPATAGCMKEHMRHIYAVVRKEGTGCAARTNMKQKLPVLSKVCVLPALGCTPYPTHGQDTEQHALVIVLLGNKATPVARASSASALVQGCQKQVTARSVLEPRICVHCPAPSKSHAA